MTETPLICAASLWARTSKDGSRYLTDRAGGLRLLVFENKRRQGDDDPSHFLMIGEAPLYQGDRAAQHAAPTMARQNGDTALARRHRDASEAQALAGKPSGPADDEAPF